MNIFKRLCKTFFNIIVDILDYIFVFMTLILVFLAAWQPGYVLSIFGLPEDLMPWWALCILLFVVLVGGYVAVSSAFSIGIAKAFGSKPDKKIDQDSNDKSAD